MQETDPERKENNHQVNETRTSMEDVDALVIANVDREWQLYHLLLSKSIKIKDILGNVEFAELEHIIKEGKKRVSKFPTGYSIWTYKCNGYTCIYQDRQN